MGFGLYINIISLLMFVSDVMQGAAYGIAGIIKGLGILSLKQLDVMGKLTEAIQEKKNFKYREGSVTVYSIRRLNS